MVKLKSYHTHYEVNNYELGDAPSIENQLSLWDDVCHKREPKYHYNELKKILYIPRGFTYGKLIETFKEPISIVREHSPKKKCSFRMNIFPRNELQLESIRFITGKEEYKYTEQDSQLVLSLGTGEGKTYCMMAALSLMETKSIIVLPTIDLKNQWIGSFKEMTKLGGPNLVDLDSSKTIDLLLDKSEKDLNNQLVYFTTHATLNSYAKRNGWDSLDGIFSHLGIGVKVIDEAHKDYANTLMIDYHTNVWKTIYLSATFGRSEEKDNKVFQLCFNEVHKFNKINEERRKHVVYVAYLLNTKPSYNDRMSCKGIKGFSRTAYMNYIMDNQTYLSNLKEIFNTFIDRDLEGAKALILSSKKESCRFFKNMVDEMCPDKKTCVHVTGSKVKNLEDYDVICATPQMLGTGLDISGLRIVIMLEPFRSHVNSDQIIGRLREYSSDKDTYYIELIDKGFDSIVSMYRDRYKNSIQHKIKKCLIIDKTKKKK